MYAYELIKTYMSCKNYIQDKQAAADLEISAAYVAQIKKGIRKMPEKTAIKIANECHLDMAEVLIKLQAEKAADETEKRAWLDVLKKYSHGITLAITITFGLPALIHSYNAYSYIMFNQRKRMGAVNYPF